MTDEQIPALGEILDYPDEQRDDDRRWIILYPEDYDDVAIDTADNVGLLMDIDQTGEILRLASSVLAELSHRDAEADEPIRDMIEALEEVLEDDD